MRLAMLATILLACHTRVGPPPAPSNVTFPREPEDTRLDHATLRALQVATDDFLPPRLWFSGTEIDRCIWSPRSLDYYVTSEADIIYVRLQINPRHCGVLRSITDAGARYAIRRSDAEILRRLLDGEPDDEPRPDAGTSSNGSFSEKLAPLPPVLAAEASADAAKAVPPSGALAFTTPSLSIAVGDCAGPVRVEARAANGDRELLAAPATVNLTAVPPSGVFSSDAKCTTAITNVDMGAGTGSVEVYFRATQVGSLQIAASTATLSGSSQTHTVTAGRAVSIVFTTPPQTLASGNCSGVVTVQARDAFGNPAHVAVATPVQLFATPEKGVTFHSRSDCTGAAIRSISLADNGDSASFYFKGRLPRTVTIAASLGTDTTSQGAIITPDRVPRSEP